MRDVLRAWREVWAAFFNLMGVTLKLFLRDPVRMLHATAHHYFGDKDKAQRLIQEIEEREA